MDTYPQERIEAVLQILSDVYPGIKAEYVGYDKNRIGLPPNFRIIKDRRLFIITVPRKKMDDLTAEEILRDFSVIDWARHLDNSKPGVEMNIEFGIVINEYD